MVGSRARNMCKGGGRGVEVEKRAREVGEGV